MGGSEVTDIVERLKDHETERAAAAKAARDFASEADLFICWACREYACMDEDDDGVEACRYECPCHNTEGLVKDAAEEIARLREELRIATDVLLGVIVQACQRDDESIDSGFIGSYADGIRWLAHYGLIELDGESSEGVYRRVAHGMLNANGETRLDNREPFVGWTPYNETT
jgi:hypothetical protein